LQSSFTRKLHAIAYLALLVEQVQNAELTFDEINARLIVIEINERPFDGFFYVLFLFKFEHML